MNRRRPSALVAVLLVATAGCGASDDDAAGSTPTLPTAATSSPGTSMPATSMPATSTTATPTIAPPPVTTPVEATTPNDLTTSPGVPVTEPSTPTGSNVDLAVADLAARLDVEPADVEILSVDAVTWPDGSLGCPQPGMSYTQALVDGQRIVLAVDGDEFEYHSGRGGEPFYCPADRVTPPVAGGGYGDT